MQGSGYNDWPYKLPEGRTESIRGVREREKLAGWVALKSFHGDPVCAPGGGGQRVMLGTQVAMGFAGLVMTGLVPAGVSSRGRMEDTASREKGKSRNRSHGLEGSY